MILCLNDPAGAEAAANVAQALAHPVRLRIMELLRDEGAYVMHLTALLERGQANISQHLAILKAAGLVVDERRGMTVNYRVNDPRVFDLLDSLKLLAAASPGDGADTARACPACSGLSRGRCPRSDGRARRCGCPRCSGDE
jgi:ArsR family transcriptional regulator